MAQPTAPSVGPLTVSEDSTTPVQTSALTISPSASQQTNAGLKAGLNGDLIGIPTELFMKWCLQNAQADLSVDSARVSSWVQLAARFEGAEHVPGERGSFVRRFTARINELSGRINGDYSRDIEESTKLIQYCLRAMAISASPTPAQGQTEAPNVQYSRQSRPVAQLEPRVQPTQQPQMQVARVPYVDPRPSPQPPPIQQQPQPQPQSQQGSYLSFQLQQASRQQQRASLAFQIQIPSLGRHRHPKDESRETRRRDERNSEGRRHRRRRGEESQGQRPYFTVSNQFSVGRSYRSRVEIECDRDWVCCWG